MVVLTEVKGYLFMLIFLTLRLFWFHFQSTQVGSVQLPFHFVSKRWHFVQELGKIQLLGSQVLSYLRLILSVLFISIVKMNSLKTKHKIITKLNHIAFSLRCLQVET